MGVEKPLSLPQFGVRHMTSAGQTQGNPGPRPDITVSWFSAVNGGSLTE